MIREPSGTLYATRDEHGTYRGTGTFHEWPIRITMNRAADIDGKPAISIRLYDGDAVSDTRHVLGPSVLIDGFGHQDEAPRAPGRGRVADATVATKDAEGGVIAALFVERDGGYFGLRDVDPWDETRDARVYAGPWPVVAHPPRLPSHHPHVLLRQEDFLT